MKFDPKNHVWPDFYAQGLAPRYGFDLDDYASYEEMESARLRLDLAELDAFKALLPGILDAIDCVKEALVSVHSAEWHGNYKKFCNQHYTIAQLICISNTEVFGDPLYKEINDDIEKSHQLLASLPISYKTSIKAYNEYQEYKDKMHKLNNYYVEPLLRSVLSIFAGDRDPYNRDAPPITHYLEYLSSHPAPSSLVPYEIDEQKMKEIDEFVWAMNKKTVAAMSANHGQT